LDRKDPNILRSLQYFEAVSRHRSVKLAAEDLGVTQSAVSHQIRRFSETIGQQLMVKSGRGITLTPAGEKLGLRLSTAFSGLEGLVKDLVGDGQQTLQLAVCSSFGPGWLIERLDDFYHSFPEIDLELNLYAQNPLFTNEVADAYIVADELKAGYTATPLKKEFLMAVEAPASKHAAKKTGKRRLITTEVGRDRVGQEWIDFCRATGTKLADLQEGSFRLCSHYLLALELAKAGQGVALVPDFLAKREIREGTLVPFHNELLPSGRTYHLCIKDSRSNEAKLKKLAEWLISTHPNHGDRPRRGDKPRKR
jgi:LysR family glycine cleavage system transcriptional activator